MRGPLIYGATETCGLVFYRNGLYRCIEVSGAGIFETSGMLGFTVPAGYHFRDDGLRARRELTDLRVLEELGLGDRICELERIVRGAGPSGDLKPRLFGQTGFRMVRSVLEGTTDAPAVDPFTYR